MDLLANGGGGVSSTDWTSIVVAVAAAIAAGATVVFALRQFRTSAREQGELRKETQELERVRTEARTRASAKKQEAAETEGEDPAEVAERTTIVRDGYFVPPFRDLPILADETQYEILRKYHAQGLAQSRASFWFSLAFASLGFVIIATAVLTIDRDASLGQQSAAVISLISGTIIDAVAGLFFVQSSRAQRVMQEFFDKLRTDRKLEESLKLVDKIADPELQGKLQVLLALNFAEVESSADVLTAVLKLPTPVRTTEASKNTPASEATTSDKDVMPK